MLNYICCKWVMTCNTTWSIHLLYQTISSAIPVQKQPFPMLKLGHQGDVTVTHVKQQKHATVKKDERQAHNREVRSR